MLGLNLIEKYDRVSCDPPVISDQENAAGYSSFLSKIWSTHQTIMIELCFLNNCNSIVVRWIHHNDEQKRLPDFQCLRNFLSSCSHQSMHAYLKRNTIQKLKYSADIDLKM